MPRGDGTGPLGYGPMTGRSAGFCAGYGVPGYANRWWCRGGLGRGWRNIVFATGIPGRARYGRFAGYFGTPFYGELTPQKEMDVLKKQVDFYQNQLETLNQRIRELEEIAAKKGASSE